MSNFNQSDISFSSAVTIAELIKNKKISPVEVLETFLNKISVYNERVNAICTLVAEQARKAAKEAEQIVMRGEHLPPLHGIPIAIKDLTPTRGIKTTFGSKIFADYIPDYDAIFVSRVKQAGAIVIGKTNTPEFGYTAVTDNLVFGTTNNPWDLTKTAGGSSGGSAAAVAAGFIPVAEGSDGGGSIRIPASACGVYGFKPGYGRIPFDIGAPMFSSTGPFLHHGTLTRTVKDAALMLDILQGADSRDPFSLPATEKSYYPVCLTDIKGLRIAYSNNLDFFEVDTQVKAATDKAMKVLDEMGCIVEEVDLGLENGHELVTKTFVTLWSVYNAAFYGQFLPQWESQMPKGLVATIKLGQKITAVEYKRTDQARSELYNKIESIFCNYDLLVSPTLAVPAFPHGPGPEEINGKAINPYTGWMLTHIFNLTGHPAASINCGYSKQGLPIGLQIVGPRFGEDQILQLSLAIEASEIGKLKVPKFKD